MERRLYLDVTANNSSVAKNGPTNKHCHRQLLSSLPLIPLSSGARALRRPKRVPLSLAIRHTKWITIGAEDAQKAPWILYYCVCFGEERP